MKIKKVFDKAWNFVTRYWYLFLAGLVLVLAALFLRDGAVENLYQSLMKKYRDALRHGQEDLQEVSDIRTREQDAQQELDAKYRQAVRQLEENKLVESQKISVDQETTIREILADTNKSPDEMAQLVHETLGLPVK